MKGGQDNLAFYADVKKSILFGSYITKVLFAAFPFYVLAQHKEENKKRRTIQTSTYGTNEIDLKV